MGKLKRLVCKIIYTVKYRTLILLGLLACTLILRADYYEWIEATNTVPEINFVEPEQPKRFCVMELRPVNPNTNKPGYLCIYGDGEVYYKGIDITMASLAFWMEVSGNMTTICDYCELYWKNHIEPVKGY